MSFVDLAGSERLRDSKSAGETLKETTSINRSLFMLGKVIAALADGAQVCLLGRGGGEEGLRAAGPIGQEGGSVAFGSCQWHRCTHGSLTCLTVSLTLFEPPSCTAL